MIDLALDNITHDLIFENFDLQLFDDTNQISQNLGIRLRFLLGEWYLDITQGIPYYQEIFKKNPNQIQIESALKAEILDTDGVLELLKFESLFDRRNRRYSVNFTVRTISGEDLQKELELPV